MPPTFGSRALFPTLEARAYLNHASISPPSLPVRQAVLDTVDRYARLGTGAVFPAIEMRSRLKGRLAALLGCAPEDVALGGSTTGGLIDLSCSLRFRPGDRILGFVGEFPANTTPWQQAARSAGGAFEMLPQEGLDDDAVLAEVEAALRAGPTRLVAVSAVQFSTGRAMPLAGIVALAHAHGAEVCVDAIQALGLMPVDVRALGIDYLVSGAHKGLMGLEGVGFVYAAPGRVAALEPRTAGWLSHTDPLGFLLDGPGRLRYDRPIRGSLDFLEGHSLSMVGCAALDAAVTLLLELGIDAIQAHVRRLLDGFEAGLVDRGFVSLRALGSPSGTLALLPPPGRSAVDWVRAFAARGVVITAPDGKLRLSPHWPNGESDVAILLEAADAILAA